MALEVNKTINTANDESLKISYDSVEDAYVMETIQSGTGVHKPFKIKVGGVTVLTIAADGLSIEFPDDTVSLGTVGNRLADIRTVLINGA